MIVSDVSITTPNFVEIIVFSFVIDEDKLVICFSKRINRYPLIATGKPTLAIKFTRSLTSIMNHLLIEEIYAFYKKVEGKILDKLKKDIYYNLKYTEMKQIFFEIYLVI